MTEYEYRSVSAAEILRSHNGSQPVVDMLIGGWEPCARTGDSFQFRRPISTGAARPTTEEKEMEHKFGSRWLAGGPKSGSQHTDIGTFADQPCDGCEGVSAPPPTLVILEGAIEAYGVALDGLCSEVGQMYEALSRVEMGSGQKGSPEAGPRDRIEAAAQDIFTKNNKLERATERLRALREQLAG